MEIIAPATGLLYADALIAQGIEHVDIRRMISAGGLVRVRRGAYCVRSIWDSADERERHLLRMRAVGTQLRTPPLFAGISAAALWRLPIAGDWSAPVCVLERYRGGGKSEPGVRRLTMDAESADAIESDGLRVTTPVRTALDIARGAPFSDAVGTVDWMLSPRNPHRVDRSLLRHELGVLKSPRGRRMLAGVIEFADGAAESFGESKTRAVLHRLGYAAPELQFALDGGAIRVDFCWPEHKVVLEFDGRVKYRAERAGQDLEAVLWNEKRREDRIRALGYRVVRLVWSDLLDPVRLDGVLRRAGIPRAQAERFA